MVIMIRRTERTHRPCGVLLPSPKPQSNHKKIPDKRRATKYLTGALQKYGGHVTQGNIENL